MFDEFQEAVINAYREKKEKGTLPIELHRPSPARLRRYCLTLLNKGDLKDDIPTLTRIFNAGNRHPDLETGIRRFEVDRFRPLRNFMMGRTINPREDDMVKLLAILIDFQPRPYDKWKNEKKGESTEGKLPPINEGDNDGSVSPHSMGENEELEGGGEKGIDQGAREIDKPADADSSSKLPRLIIYGIVAAAVIFLGVYLFKIGDKQCMYWAGDRYESISCADTAVKNKIALDKSLLKNMKKNTQQDTLTKKDLGKAWYVKITVDSIEFYTSDGFHPIYNDKKMKPVTAYILDKYILAKNRNSL